MKKIFYLVICFSLALTFSITNLNFLSAKATTISSRNIFATSVNQTLNELSGFSSRVAGTDGETAVADYIHSRLSGIAGLEPANVDGIKNGFQTFKFRSYFLAGYAQSRNVLFIKRATTETEKKVVLACNYDSLSVAYNENSGKYEIFNSLALNQSAGSIALLLEIAETIASESYDFNIEIIFFGAGENNCDGARYYLSGLTQNDLGNIICMIDFNKVSVGKNNYFYVDEIETNLTKFVDNFAYENEISISPINLEYLSKDLAENDEDALSYSHVAMESENLLFTNNGINSISFLTGEYETGLIVGNQEFDGKQSVIGTANDNYDYIIDLYGENHVTDNLYNYYKLTTKLLESSEFVAAANSTSTKLFHKVFSSEKLVTYLTAVMFVVGVILTFAVHYKLTIKSYYVNVEEEFLKSVLKISDELDITGKNQDIPKVVSQVIAKDIKKNKTIKEKKNKKDSK